MRITPIFTAMFIALLLSLASVTFVNAETREGVYTTFRVGKLTETDTSMDKKAFSPVLGYDWGVVRADLEYNYRGDITVNGPSDARTQSALASIYFDWENDILPVTPFVGAGLGVGWIDTDGKQENGFAWHASAGAYLELAKGWDIEFMYRYSEIGTNFTYGTNAKDKFNSQEIYGGLRFTF